MKTEKLNLLALKLNELSRENLLNISAGWPIDGKPPVATTNIGSGLGFENCSYDFETGEIVCVPIEYDPEIFYI